MKPIEFPNQNTVFAENQAEYQSLPAHQTTDSEVISCWRLSLWERVRVLFTGCVWLRTWTFHRPLQPLYLQVENPWKSKPRGKNDE